MLHVVWILLLFTNAPVLSEYPAMLSAPMKLLYSVDSVIRQLFSCGCHEAGPRHELESALLFRSALRPRTPRTVIVHQVQ